MVWKFDRHGGFCRKFTSDYAEVYSGAWALSQATPNSGIVFLASTKTKPSRFDVFSVSLEGNELRLGEETYRALPHSEDDRPVSYAADDQQAVTGGQRAQHFAMWSLMTQTDWHTDFAAYGDPSQYSFHRSGIYTATFADTACRYSGTWSLMTIGGNISELRLTVPANDCDPRGHRPSFVRELPAKLMDEQLILYRSSYSPK